MNILKKFLLTLVLVLPFQVAMPYSDSDFNFDELDDLDESMIDHAITRQAFNTADCYSWLVDIGQANELLAEDFYSKTYFLNTRPINSYPNFLNYHYNQTCQDRTFNIFAFYNQTSKMNYTKQCAGISSYINVGPDQGFISVIREKLNDLLLEQAGVDIPKTIGLFVGGKVQERRAGLLMQILKTYKNYTFEISMPLLYQERNYFFSEEEQKDLRDNLGSSTEEQTEEIARGHLVCDRFGIGDTRIKIGYPTARKERFCADIGAQITLPTAFSFKKGLYGSNLRKKCMKRPEFELCNLIILALDSTQKDAEKAAEIGTNFGLNAIDWLSAMLLDAPLGNNKHFAIGFFIDSNFKIDKNINLDSVLSLEYIIPRQERRFFIKKKNKAVFDNDRFPDLDPDNPNDIHVATKLTNFLNEQTLETFFPYEHLSIVSPGFVLQFTVSPKVTIRDWTFNVGYDFWLRQKERINPIFDQSIEALKYSAAPRCLQSKLFAAVKFNKFRECHDWAVSLNADYTLSKSGIGRDFTCALGFQVNF